MTDHFVLALDLKDTRAAAEAACAQPPVHTILAVLELRCEDGALGYAAVPHWFARSTLMLQRKGR